MDYKILKPAERITLIEEWQGDTRTRYILKPDGRKELMDQETITPRPFVKLKPQSVPVFEHEHTR